MYKASKSGQEIMDLKKKANLKYMYNTEDVLIKLRYHI